MISEYKTEYLTLSFNITLLGLLLARLFAKSSSTQNTDGFFIEVIRLLSHAYHLSRPSGPDVTFIVNDTYVPHWECVEDLWMLSMQSKMRCLPSVDLMEPVIMSVNVCYIFSFRHASSIYPSSVRRIGIFRKYHMMI